MTEPAGGHPSRMESQRPTPTADDVKQDNADAPDYKDLQPPETTQDPVEDPDAVREPGHTKS